MHPELSERELLDFTIVTYAEELRFSYHDIARLTGLSIAEVGRTLRRSRESVQTRVEFAADPERDQAVRAAVFDRLRHPELAERAAGRLGAQNLPPSAIWVVPSDPGSSERTVKRAAAAGAEVLLAFLERTPPAAPPVLGVSWGRSLFHFSRAVAALSARRSRCFPEATVFNLAGDFVRLPTKSPADTDNPLTHWASTIAGQLAEALGSRRLIRAYGPGWIPLDGQNTTADIERSRKSAERFLTQYPGYDAVFGRTGFLATESATAMFTGIGSRATFSGLIEGTFLRGCTKAGRAQLSAVQRSSVGDISCTPLGSRGVLHGEGADFLRAAFLGVNEDHLRALAERARRSSDCLGVVALAVGKEKAEAVKAAAREQLVNVLVLDSACAEALDA